MLSWEPLQNQKSHGFFRYFAWVAILTLWMLKTTKYPEKILDLPEPIPISLLMASLCFVVLGFGELWRKGKISKNRDDITLFSFEKTTQLVTSGIYQFVRHPVYTSLLLLAWGLLCQHPSLIGLGFALGASYTLFMTARADERECIAFFGQKYSEYIKTTRAFIPYVL